LRAHGLIRPGAAGSDGFRYRALGAGLSQPIPISLENLLATGRPYRISVAEDLYRNFLYGSTGRPGGDRSLDRESRLGSPWSIKKERCINGPARPVLNDRSGGPQNSNLQKVEEKASRPAAHGDTVDQQKRVTMMGKLQEKGWAVVTGGTTG